MQKQTSTKTAHTPAVTRKPFFTLLVDKMRLSSPRFSSSPVIARLIRRVAIFSGVFFLLTSFIPLYQFTEGYHSDDMMSVLDFTNQETSSALDTIMTEDGFLLKPALNSTEGDRSTANEIFAYEVESGDTLSSIAQRFGVKRETLIMENNLWNANRVRSGMTLKILPVDGISHLVKKGDTVEKIAKKYKIETEEIVRQNQLEDADELLVGSALIVPGGKKALNSYVAGGSSAPRNVAGYHGSTASKGRLIWPALKKATLTQGYHRSHYALDIAHRSKGPIFAAASGKVIRADASGWNGGYGQVVIIDHGGGMQTLYAHNEKLYVTEGQYVEQGQTIAWMGRTGRVYGPTGIHLHFEVRINGVKYNPMNFF